MTPDAIKIEADADQQLPPPELVQLRTALSKKTAECIVANEKLVHKTSTIHHQDEYIATLERELCMHADKEKRWLAEQASLVAKIARLEEQQHLVSALRGVLDESHYLARQLSSTLLEQQQRPSLLLGSCHAKRARDSPSGA